MTTLALWLPLLASACTGKIEDDSQPSGDDSNTKIDDTTDDSATADDSDGGTTDGHRWDGKYTGAWGLTFDDPGKIKDNGTCNGGVVLTVAAKDINVDVTLAACDGIGLKVYGDKPTPTITDGTIDLNPDSPTNKGNAHFTLVGTKETCEFDFEWTFADNHDPTQVAANHTLLSDSEFKKYFCAGAGYTLDFLAEIPKKD
jgi:hypothetical protein